MTKPAHSLKIYSEKSSVLDYFLLMKPRVMSLVVFTGYSGLYLAPGNIHFFTALTAIILIALGAGSAAAINMWYDRDIDQIMQRTRQRPIIRGAIEPDEALAFGVITAILSVILMSICVNITSSILLAITILYYVFIYTSWLKRLSVYNIVIGGVAGALPPMIGFAAVTNDISLKSFSLFLIILLWTPPHSWALALFRLQDYKDSKVPMLPVIKGKYYTKKQILFYSIAMCAAVLWPYFLLMVNFNYILLVSGLNLGFLWQVALLFRNQTNKQAKRLFGYSILYLFVIFLALMIFKVS